MVSHKARLKVIPVVEAGLALQVPQGQVAHDWGLLAVAEMARNCFPSVLLPVPLLVNADPATQALSYALLRSHFCQLS